MVLEKVKSMLHCGVRLRCFLPAFRLALILGGAAARCAADGRLMYLPPVISHEGGESAVYMLTSALQLFQAGCAVEEC